MNRVCSLCSLLTILIYLLSWEKEATIGKIETVKEYTFVSVKDLNQLEQQTLLKVSSLDDFKQMVNVLIDHTEIGEDLIEQNVHLPAEKGTDLGRTNKLKMNIGTGNHLAIKLRPFRTPLAKHPILDKAVNDMLMQIL